MLKLTGWIWCRNVRSKEGLEILSQQNTEARSLRRNGPQRVRLEYTEVESQQHNVAPHSGVEQHRLLRPRAGNYHKLNHTQRQFSC